MALFEFRSLVKAVTRMAVALERQADALELASPPVLTHPHGETTLIRHNTARGVLRAQLMRKALQRGLSRADAKTEVAKFLAAHQAQRHAG